MNIRLHMSLRVSPFRMNGFWGNTEFRAVTVIWTGTEWFIQQVNMGWIPGKGKGFFFSPLHQYLRRGPPRTLFFLEALSPGGKAVGEWIWPFIAPSSAEVNAWIYSATLLYTFMAWCLSSEAASPLRFSDNTSYEGRNTFIEYIERFF
jgi:hypothetical protein